MSFPAYPEYNESGVQWLGQVPSTWASVPFGALFRRTKRTGFAEEELLSVYRDYGVIRKSDRDDNFNNASEDLSTYQLVEPGDLAMNKMKAWQGSLGISSHCGIVSPAYFVFAPRREFHPPFMHHLLRSPPYAAAYMTISKGIRINQWDVDPDHLSALPVLLPSFDEQETIAAFLDLETAKIDALVAEQERLIALLKEKRQAVTSHAVTKGLNPDAPMKDSGIEWLGDIPAHWDCKRLRHLASLNPSKSEIADLDGETEVSFLPMEAIGEDGQLSLHRTRPITDVMTGYTYFREGDVTIAKITPCFENGKGAIMQGLVHGVGFGTTELIVVRPDRNHTSPEFLNWLFRSSPFRALGEGAMYGAGGQKRVPDEFVRDFAVGLPPYVEQTQIVAHLNSITLDFDRLTSEAQAAITLLQERRAALISAAVTGKIDVRGLVDAPATAELETA